jgi:hypothetical protein
VLTGGSWGGFLTLLGIGTQPDDWSVAVAAVPVAIAIPVAITIAAVTVACAAIEVGALLFVAVAAQEQEQRGEEHERALLFHGRYYLRRGPFHQALRPAPTAHGHRRRGGSRRPAASGAHGAQIDKIWRDFARMRHAHA